MRCCLFVLISCASIAVGAKESDEREQVGAPNIQQYQEVERGFWLRSTFGFQLALSDPFGGDGKVDSWPPGPVLGVEIGVDLGQVASIQMALLSESFSVTKSANQIEIGNDSGIFGALLGLRFNLMTTKRLGWFIKGGVGYLISAPEMAALENGIIAQAGTGIEYATNLRHFFVGLELVGQFVQSNSALSLLVTPTLKYAF